MKKPIHQHIRENMTKKRLLLAGGILLLIIAALVSLGFWLYSAPYSSAKVKTFKKFDLPVARVGSYLIGGRELFNRHDLAEQLYNGSSGYDANQSQGQILDRLIEIEKMEIIAAQRGVKVTESELDAEYDRLADQAGGNDAFATTLKDKYHFTVEQFKQKALKPDILKTNLQINFYNDKSLNPELYATLDKVNAALKSNTDFAEVAKTYSEDPATSQFGGDSGMIPLKDLAPEFQKELLGKQPNDIVTATTRFGIYVIKVINRKGDDGNGGGSIHFQSIYLNYGKFSSKENESAFSKWYKSQAGAIKEQKFINL